jgi:hypothetical protein
MLPPIYELIPRPSQLREGLATVVERFDLFENNLHIPHELPNALLQSLHRLRRSLNGIIDAIPTDEDDLNGTKLVMRKWDWWKARAQAIRLRHRLHDEHIRFIVLVPF